MRLRRGGWIVILCISCDLLVPSDGSACSEGDTCGCGLGNCTCGFFYSTSCTDSKGDFCCPCRPGSYCDCFSACEGPPKPCPEGTFNPTSGSHSPGDCRVCPDGHICAFGAVQPVACRPGYYCPVVAAADCPRIGLDPCEIPCPVGTSGAPGNAGQKTEKTACSKCAPGKYGASEGLLECSPCPPGTFAAAEGSEQCGPCPAGHYCEQKTVLPHPCPENTYSSEIGARESASCLPCPGNRSGPRGSASDNLCNLTRTATGTTATTSTSMSRTTTSVLLQETPAPVVQAQVMKTVKVRAQANVVGIAGQDAFYSCCETHFVNVFASMVHLNSSRVRIYQLCDSVLGCKTAKSRNLLQTEVQSVLVKFEMETTDQLALINLMRGPSFSFTFSSRFASAIDDQTVTVSVNLIAEDLLAVGEPPPKSPNGPTRTEPVSNNASSFLSTFVVSITAALFICCNCVWFHKRIRKTLCSRCLVPTKAPDDDRHDLEDRAHGQSATSAYGTDEEETDGTAEERSGPGQTRDNSHHSCASSEVSPDPPSHVPLSLVIRPSSNIISEASRTVAQAPDETIVPSALAVQNPTRDGTGDNMSRKQSQCSPLMEPTTALANQVSLVSSGKDSDSASSGCSKVEHVPHNHRSEASLDVDSSALFDLDIADSPKDAWQSAMEADDLKPLFEMVSHVASDKDESVIDSAALLELLRSLDPSADESKARAVYMAANAEFHSKLSLPQLQNAWHLLRNPTAKGSESLPREAMNVAGEAAMADGEDTASPDRAPSESGASANSWDAD